MRVPAHPLALDLLRAYAQAGDGRDGMCGVAAPSANRFGRISPTDAAHVREELGDAVALVLDGGPCEVGIESTIIDLSRDDRLPRILRPGHITPEQIAAVIGVLPETPATKKDAATPRVSGSLDAHYAPRTPMRIVATAQLSETLAELNRAGKSVGLLAHAVSSASCPAHSWCLLPDEPEGFARGFYAALRELDQGDNDLIVVEAIPSGADWMAVADRLRRAACGAGESA